MRASLPMYALPEMQAANDAFWCAVRTEARQLGVTGLPAALDLDRGPVTAIGPDVVFTQVCGWPLHTIYAGQAVVLGVPAYAAPHCAGATHAGLFIVRAGSRYCGLADLRGCRFVFNSAHSNTGMNLPRRAIAALSPGAAFFASAEESGAHAESLSRVAAGLADATCVDSVTYAFAARHRPGLLAGLRVLGATPPSPAIPFVTAAATPPGTRAALAAALHRAATSPDWAAAQAGLMLTGMAAAADFTIPLRYAEEADALGYPTLR